MEDTWFITSDAPKPVLAAKESASKSVDFAGMVAREFEGKESDNEPSKSISELLLAVLEAADEK